MMSVPSQLSDQSSYFVRLKMFPLTLLTSMCRSFLAAVIAWSAANVINIWPQPGLIDHLPVFAITFEVNRKLLVSHTIDGERQALLLTCLI